MTRIFRILIAFVLLYGFISPIEATAANANPIPDCSAGTTCTILFNTSNDYFQWMVPTGVTSLTFDVRGAKGSGSSSDSCSPGGLGGKVTGTYSVTSGTTLYIYVGGRSGTSTAGWNGGGSGYGTGGGGGGASDIRTIAGDLNSRVIVAGGGGGGVANYACGIDVGGAGGGLTGAQGISGDVNLRTGGGTQSGGGAQSNWSGYAASNPGSFGLGGNSASCCSGAGGGGGYYGGGAGSWVGGGGGSSYANATYVSSVVHSQGVQNGTGSVSLTYQNSPQPTTFSTTQTSPANFGVGATVSYTLVLSQSVSDLAGSDFKFGGSSSCNTPTLSGSGTSYTVSITNCSEGALILQLKANSITGTSAGPPSDVSAATIVIDRTLPTISTVSAPANGTYKPTDTPTFSVQFSESVTVTGTPRLVLTVGSQTRYANYVSKSDSRTALFRYTVGLNTSEVDSDGISLATELDLNSGTVVDSAGNALIVVSLTPPTLTSVLVAQPPAAPTIDSIAATSTQLSVYFRPGTTYGSSITNYEYSTNNGGSWTLRSPVSTVSPLVITGLTDNTSYQVRIRAISGAGTSDSSTALTGTPTAIVVSGNSSLTTTFGTSANTGTYTASGGTGPYTFSLSNTANSISISGGVVTVASTTPAGTYTRDVIATDSQSKTGLKQLIITVSKASSMISLALQGGGTSTPAGQAPVLNITTSIAGSVDFFVGGGGLPSCTAIAIASTTGTCTLPTPPSTGSVTVTAIFTPTSGNYETSTASITLTIVDGVSTITISLAGGVTQVPKSQPIVITAAIDRAGKVSFYADGKRIPGCINLSATVGNQSCTWKPAVQKQVNLTATLNPTSSVYKSSSVSMIVAVTRRTGTR
jgi:hypothetical protein